MFLAINEWICPSCLKVNDGSRTNCRDITCKTPRDPSQPAKIC